MCTISIIAPTDLVETLAYIRILYKALNAETQVKRFLIEIIIQILFKVECTLAAFISNKCSKLQNRVDIFCD